MVQKIWGSARSNNDDESFDSRATRLLITSQKQGMKRKELPTLRTPSDGAD
jgi:hypothetical protein